ncbi:MAG: IS66 family transposase [Pirellulales bacterium]
MSIQDLQRQLSDQLQITLQLRDDLVQVRRLYDLLQANQSSLEDTTSKVMSERDQLKDRVAELEAVNKKLVNMLWGRRSERRVPDPNQSLLPGAEAWYESPADRAAEVVAGEETQETADLELIKKWEAEKARRRALRQAQQQRPQEFPAHLERRERVLDLTEEQKAGLTPIGEAVTERLRFERPHVYVERIVRHKYVQAGESERGVISPPAPLSIVEGCKYDFSVIAAIVALKFAFHQPTYRQQDWFSQCGWFPNRSTINDLINAATMTVSPLVAQMWQLLLQQSVLMIDETRVRLLTRDSLTDEQLGKLASRGTRASQDDEEMSEEPTRGSVNSYAWVFTSPDSMAPYNWFHWTLTRRQETVDELLANYRGTIVGDGYDGYTNIERRSQGRIVYAACNTHARREFVQAETYEPILCAQVEALYRQLSSIEHRAKVLAAEERLALRQREAAPIWQMIDTWTKSEPVQRAALPSNPFGKAIGYLKNHWPALQRYLHDADVPMTNDQVEQTIRPLTVGRRNWLFLGHPAAAPGRMQLLSVVSSAHRHNLMIEDYLVDVLTKLADARQNHPHDLALGSQYLLDLLPDRWAASHPQSIRRERVAEKQDVAEAKRVRRAKRRQELRTKLQQHKST